ncbi:OprD family outer membrane porin [Endozoicomonas lisbonensis]|uniref:Imipenem/basic amino acid-specific outer membrane pore n=1 Tax=Endozoicomonas lisbonensis TaxID=3120522 RepID=A0ABV2SAQ8_9GAMM
MTTRTTLHTLTAAIIAVTGASLAQASSMDAATRSDAEMMTFDPSLTLTYKNYYFRDKPKSDSGYEIDEWVHGVMADFDSGYVNNKVGAVVTTGFASPISVKDGFSTSTPTNSKGDGANAIAGFQQAYVKARYGVDQLEFVLNAGVKVRSFELYGDSGSRVLPSSTNGADLTASFADANLYATRIRGFSARNDSVFSGDLTNGSEKIDHLTIVGGNYSVAGVGLAAEVAESTDYLKKSFVKASYDAGLNDSTNLSMDVRYGTAKENGKLYANNDYKSKYYNVNAKVGFGNAYVGLGYNKTADGDYDNGFFAGDHGKFNSGLAQWEDNSLQDEKAYVVSAGYNFADQGMAGLGIDLWYVNGSDAKDIDDFKRREFGSLISYQFDGQLEGLSVKWLHVNYKAEGTATGSRTSLPGTIYKEKINRFYVTYDFLVF